MGRADTSPEPYTAKLGFIGTQVWQLVNSDTPVQMLKNVVNPLLMLHHLFASQHSSTLQVQVPTHGPIYIHVGT